MVPHSSSHSDRASIHEIYLIQKAILCQRHDAWYFPMVLILKIAVKVGHLHLVYNLMLL